MNEIIGYTDILKIGDEVQVCGTEHKSTISEVVKCPHCYVYRLQKPQWEFNWHFRAFIIKL